MTRNEICVCAHAGRDHEKICQVAGCACVNAKRMEPQPYWVEALEKPEQPVNPLMGYYGIP